jgi:hypothetical protein
LQFARETGATLLNARPTRQHADKFQGLFIFTIMSKESHSFSVSVAKEIGVHAALGIQHLCFLQKSNTKDGQLWQSVWVRRSAKSFTETYEYLSIKEIRGMLERLEREELVVSKIENQDVFDRRKSYRITEKGLILIGFEPCDKRANADTQKGISHVPKRANAMYPKGQMLYCTSIVSSIIQQQKAKEATVFTVKETLENKKVAPAAALPFLPPAAPPYRRVGEINLNEELAAIGKDFNMREGITRVARVPQKYFEEYLDAFAFKEISTGSNHNNRKELREHFFNFCRKRYQSERADIKPTTSALPSNMRKL